MLKSIDHNQCNSWSGSKSELSGALPMLNSRKPRFPYRGFLLPHALSLSFPIGTRIPLEITRIAANQLGDLEQADTEFCCNIVRVRKPVAVSCTTRRTATQLGGEIVTAVVIITTFISVIFGTVIIRIYLSNFSIPISPLDAFSVSSLQIFMVFFVTLLTGAVALFLIPLFATYFVDPETRYSFPKLFGRRYIPPVILRPRTLATRQQRPALLLARGALILLSWQNTGCSICRAWVLFGPYLLERILTYRTRRYFIGPFRQRLVFLCSSCISSG